MIMKQTKKERSFIYINKKMRWIVTRRGQINARTVLKIITNLGPSRSKAENKCSVPTNQRIRSRHKVILELFEFEENNSSTISEFLL
jgi:hypothetical protein